MSQAAIEQFYAAASKDPRIARQVYENIKSPEDWLNNAVKVGKAHGFDFTLEEARAWSDAKRRELERK